MEIEEITAKRKKYDKNGEEMKWGRMGVGGIKQMENNKEHIPKINYNFTLFVVLTITSIN